MINDLYYVNSEFDERLNWTQPIDENLLQNSLKTLDYIKTFDQNGYDLCELEKLYVDKNIILTNHRGFRTSILKPWFQQKEKLSGYILNHSMLLERKGFGGLALEQLNRYVKSNPLLYKLINYKTKWGLDLSIDYVDETGECFEVFHYEYDSFDLDKIKLVKSKVEEVISNTDFDYVVKDLINRKSEWFNLEFFEQSKWKTDYFNLEPERFKMVGWQ